MGHWSRNNSKQVNVGLARSERKTLHQSQIKSKSDWRIILHDVPSSGLSQCHGFLCGPASARFQVVCSSTMITEFEAMAFVFIGIDIGHYHRDSVRFLSNHLVTPFVTVLGLGIPLLC